MRLTTLGLASLFLAVSVPAWADATVYRWKDASGQVHFGQTPPTSGGYDVMRGMHSVPISPPSATPAPPASPGAADQRTREQKFLEEAEAARKAKDEAKAKERAAKLERDKRCIAARDREKFMQTNFELYGGDEVVKQLDAAKKDIAANCS